MTALSAQPEPISRNQSVKSLRIAFAMINCNRRDGSARAVNEVAERLAVRHNVHLFARKAEDIDLGNITWHRVPGQRWAEVVDFWTYHQMVNHSLKADLYDIVHSIGCNTLKSNVVTIQNIQPAKKIILDRLGSAERVSPARRLTRWLYLRTTCAAERRLYTARPGRRQPLFLPVSRGVEAELRAHYEIGDAPVRIVPNAADTERFKPLSDEQRHRWREVAGIPQDKPLAVFAGGEWARKGLDMAIEAMARLRRVDAHLLVAGDDPGRDRFVALARELGIAERIHFVGFRKDMAEALAAADLLLFPSWYEAFSLATIEAAACGLPIVASKINGTEDFIVPGHNGAFVRHDAEDIARVLEPLVADLEHCRELGRNARDTVGARYTWERVARMTEDAYHEYLELCARP